MTARLSQPAFWFRYMQRTYARNNAPIPGQTSSFDHRGCTKPTPGEENLLACAALHQRDDNPAGALGKLDDTHPLFGCRCTVHCLYYVLGHSSNLWEPYLGGVSSSGYRDERVRYTPCMSIY